MTTGHMFIATSLDGFVARRDHQLDWLMKQPTQGEEHGYDAFMESVDGLVMGRGSYENVLTFGQWPYAKPVVVMSKTLRASDLPPELAGKVRVTELEPIPLMASLHEAGWSRAYVDGGKVVQSFLACGLIEDMVLTLVPILLGDGLRLFGKHGDNQGDIDLELIDATPFPSGLLQTRYRIVRAG